MNTILPFIITFLAGISTLIGILPTYLNKKYKDEIVNISLGISTGVMLSVSILSLIPESIYYLNKTIVNILLIFIFILIGLLLSKNISKITKTSSSNHLYKIGLISMISLIIHNIPEGIITYLSTEENIRLGLTLSIAIAIHNIPEGIAISIPIYYSTNSRKKAFLYTLIAGFSEFLGAIFAYLFLESIITRFSLALILSITAGLMIHISLFELFPIINKHKKHTYLSILFGIVLMVICIYYFKI